MISIQKGQEVTLDKADRVATMVNEDSDSDNDTQPSSIQNDHDLGGSRSQDHSFSLNSPLSTAKISVISKSSNESKVTSERSYFSVGQQIYDGGYSDGEEEASIPDRIDFSAVKVQSRDQQTQRLHHLYSFVSKRGLGRKLKRSKGETCVALVTGVSGTGKSTLVKNFIAELERKTKEPGSPRSPFFICGKFDELAGADPFSAIVEALSGFAKTLLSGETNELERIRNCIKGQLGPETATLTSIIPGLKAIIQDERTIKGSRENAKNKLRYIFQTFFNAISTKERPVVMFMDDLQWCDLASLELIFALLTDLDLRYFMFIGAYRHDEVTSESEIAKCFAVVNEVQLVTPIKLSNLSMEELNVVIQDLLQRKNPNETIQLTSVIFSRTNGNIFHSIQVLEELQRKNVLLFSRLTFQWEWSFNDLDLDKILADDMLQVVTDKITNSDPDLQRILILMAYTRSSIDVHTLSELTIINGSKISSADLLSILDQAVMDGLLTNSVGSGLYSFGHDKIQQAAFAMVPAGQDRNDLRLELGFRLYEMGMTDVNNDWKIFVAADHLNATAVLVNDIKDSLFLIEMNLKVGDRASSISAYQAASTYLVFARQYLNKLESCWESHYDTALRVYEASTSVELCLGHYERGTSMGEEVLSHARSFEEKLPTYVAICKATGRQEKHRETFMMSIEILQSLGVLSRSAVVRIAKMIQDFLHIRKYFSKHTNAQILDHPITEDKTQLIISDLLTSAAYHAYLCCAQVDYLTCTLRALRFGFTHGFGPHTGVAMMGYSLFCNTINNMEGAHRFSHLARRILEKTHAREQECLQLFVVLHFMFAWKDPHDKVIALYEHAYKIGMESGDYENAILSATASCHHSFVAGHSLPILESRFSSVLEKLNVHKVDSVKCMTVQQLLPIPYLRGTSKIPLDFEMLAKFGPTGIIDSSSENYQLLYGYVGRLELALYFNEYEFALSMLKKLRRISNMDMGFAIKSIRLSFQSLAYSSLCLRHRRRSYLKKSRRFLRQLRALCQNKGLNGWHRCILMEANLLAAQGRHRIEVQDAYDCAIGAATQSGHKQDAALGAQLAAEYFLCLTTRGKESQNENAMMVRQYLMCARDLYLEWGAVALVIHLEKRYFDYMGTMTVPTSRYDAEIISITPSTRSASDKLGSLPARISERRSLDNEKEDISVLTMETALPAALFQSRVLSKHS